MALEFAAAEARMGAALIRALANARAVFGSDSRAMADGIFNEAPGSSSPGSLAMRTRQYTFHCSTADLTVPVDDGTAVTLYRDDQLTQPFGGFVVMEGGRVDDVPAGTTVLELERA